MAKSLFQCLILSNLITLPSCSCSHSDGPQSEHSDDPSAGKAVGKHAEKERTQVIRILNDNESRQIATKFLNGKLKERKFLAPSGEIDFPPIEVEAWESIVYDYRQRRIVLRFGGSGGWEAIVSFARDGSDPKMEHAEFAWN
jgi:hypothetical protein